MPNGGDARVQEGRQAKGSKKMGKKKAHSIASSLRVIKSYPKEREKCLDTSLLTHSLRCVALVVGPHMAHEDRAPLVAHNAIA
ncbi:hypothetical protein E2C01_034631 [Portunus trituberculatus]|uniref:Uncharacterized protein n=1 Tax=Portunus trituberculatus TaxID=210409 RepID=A0A5B7F131_PORTR|nr:hypothetical protein [Portunus trituberculatus]